MNKKDEFAGVGRLEQARQLAGRIMHMHYCDNDIEGIVSLFADEFSWIGTGEEEYISRRENCVSQFLSMKGGIPECRIWGEEYDAIRVEEDLYVVMGRMWIATEPSSQMYLKVHQRVTFVFRDSGDDFRCVHIHCSNPYQEMVAGEHFPDKIGRQSYEYVQERLSLLEEEILQQNRQLEVIMSSIAGGLKISNDDDSYSYAFVSKEAAALFGYTVEEFMEVTGGTAVGNVYPPDLPNALADCAEAFRDGGLTYSTRYRVRCKDGSLKWVIDSGKKAQSPDGSWMVNSLYLDVTRSEEDAQRLREQTQLLSSIYDTVPCGIIRFAKRKDGTCPLISLNKAILSLLGYEKMEDGLSDWRDGVLGAVLEEDRLKMQELYSRLRGDGDREDIEYRVAWKDGSVHWMEGTSMVVGLTPEGDTVLQRTVVDITQRTIFKQRLDREQEMYRVAMEVSFSVMFEYLIEEDTFISYEPKFGQGVERRELRNYSKIILEQDFIHPDDVPVVLDNICNGRAEVFEVRCRQPEGESGHYVWYRADSRLMLEDGRPSRVVGALHNIHSMKAKLSENSERLYMNQSALQAINGVYVSIFYVDLEKDSYYAVRLTEGFRGPVFPRIGTYSGELCGYILEDVAPSEQKKVADICDRSWLLRELTEQKEHIEVEFRHKTPALWLRMEIHLASGREKDSKTAILAFRNISAEKQKELEHYEEEKRAKAALEEAYASLNQANQAKSEFLSRMSHDIRTPMNAIIGMTAIAENSVGDDEKMADCLAKIRRSSGQLLELLNEVLDMSKIESGSTSLREEAFRLEEVFNEVSELIRPEVERKSQHYSLRVGSLEHGAVYGDSVRVKQILTNLLSNAVKYTEKNGHICARLEEKLSSESGVGCFEFVVEDDGLGMPPEFLEKIFLPFERADDPRIQKIQGTGLGLPIALSLVQMMNGTIQVESRLNQGTRFTVTIFLKLVQDEKLLHGREAAGGEKLTADFRPGIRILLTEDNALNQEIAKELLKLCGLEVVCADNGREAVTRFSGDPAGTYDLILMDIQMPILDGYGAAREIRRLAETGERPDAADIPIVALTANAFADDIYRAKQAGMNEHVTKPLEIGRLKEVIHRWVK